MSNKNISPNYKSITLYLDNLNQTRESIGTDKPQWQLSTFKSNEQGKVFVYDEVKKIIGLKLSNWDLWYYYPTYDFEMVHGDAVTNALNNAFDIAKVHGNILVEEFNRQAFIASYESNRFHFLWNACFSYDDNSYDTCCISDSNNGTYWFMQPIPIPTTITLKLASCNKTMRLEGPQIVGTLSKVNNCIHITFDKMHYLRYNIALGIQEYIILTNFTTTNPVLDADIIRAVNGTIIHPLFDPADEGLDPLYTTNYTVVTNYDISTVTIPANYQVNVVRQSFRSIMPLTMYYISDEENKLETKKLVTNQSAIDWDENEDLSIEAITHNVGSIRMSGAVFSKSMVILDSFNRDNQGVSTQYMKWNYYPEQANQLGTVFSNESIENIYSMKTLRVLFPTIYLPGLDYPSRYLTLLINEFSGDAYFHKNRNYHFSYRPLVNSKGIDDDFIDAISWYQLLPTDSGEFIFRTPIKSISSFTISFANPTNLIDLPLSFVQNKLNQYTSVGITTEITVTAPISFGSFSDGDKIILSNYTTNDPIGDKDLIDVMNSQFGHIITKIDLQTISIDIDTTGILYPVDAATITVTIYNETNHIIVPIVFSYIKIIL